MSKRHKDGHGTMHIGKIIHKLREVVKRVNQSQCESGPGTAQHCGGIRRRKSECCGADIEMSGHGFMSEICSKCGRPAPMPVFRSAV